ncbi:MAG: undecaprenyl-diphosphate phosphatase, partial [Bacteroidales bacterium]|nr:undecaprenyl-diphosphate phosphatase [Bacteroidales bacterium]
TVSYFVKKGDREINWLDALIIGVGQAVAVMPGLSRSGTTIATGMIIGNKPSCLAKFSFLLVIIPVLGEMFLDLVGGDIATAAGSVGAIPVLVGFLAAFLSGLFACKWMIRIVSKGKLVWFAVYCVIIGVIAIICGL